jgi:alpha-tubulin suppressor-like RCC1 family protein
MAVSAGMVYTVALSEEGEVFAWGGLNAREHQINDNDNGIGDSRVGGVEIFGARAVQVAAGGWHAACLTADGVLWTWGDGAAGRLGHGDERKREMPTKLGPEMFGGYTVVMVAAGSFHTLLVTTDGEAWSFGWGLFGQQGQGDKEDRLIPTKVGAYRFGGAKIVMVAAGMGHSLAVTEDGVLWTWGCAFHGCLGHNDETERSVPEMLARQLFSDSSVVLVSAGAAHSVAVTLDGALWAWGNGEFGRLGVGDVSNRLIPTRVGVDDAFGGFGGSGVLLAACGDKHTLAVTNDGTLWSWGRGERGELGHNDRAMRIIPTRVDADHFDGAKVVATAGTQFACFKGTHVHILTQLPLQPGHFTRLQLQKTASSIPGAGGRKEKNRRALGTQTCKTSTCQQRLPRSKWAALA